ncbi:hypothetical protein PR202_ga22203 [Eleusine coracana subsp. coracana]|uniref:NB-ARC domain-containing protein n=1 Tax=Eleusine coracana subsp. coracana TaxID=191504 RepID=A0AAV5D2Y7_ELECO|nr:hypothetical protein PR202_ga22203 [Eleusine coracana subsp. coracana]
MKLLWILIFSYLFIFCVGCRSYLVVIDDIWDKSLWEKIKYIFVGNVKANKIIITTRILDVAKQAGGIYQIKPLSYRNSKKLFYQRIFGSEDKCPPLLANVSEKILKKCGGVPLAIITIASLLASKRDQENIQNYWSVYHLMGSGLEDSPDMRDMRRILSVSYYDLPPHLKTCLLYLSSYPEDYEISRETVVWKWVGESFVNNEKGKSLHEVGKDYFDELINKSMVQPTSFDIHGRATHCRMHDMVLDLINSLSNEENFMTIIGGQQVLSPPKKIRRLSLQASKEEDVKQLSTLCLSHVRSLTVSKHVFKLLPSLLSFPVLRVLDLSDCELVDEQHCKDICNLFHLRYLNLSATYIKAIPKEIGSLQFLQVLNIDKTNIEELPSTFVQLGQLACLHLPETLRRLPDSFGTLHIEEFMRISVSKSQTILHVDGFTSLRHLYIHFGNCDDSYAKAFSQFLSRLVSLEMLEVSGSSIVNLGSAYENLSPGPQRLWTIDMSDCYNGVYEVPGWMPSLSSLSRLCIHITVVSEKDLRILSSIPCLSWLQFGAGYGIRGLVIDSSYPFRCLAWLEVVSSEMMRFAPGAMQKLRTLSVPNPNACWPVCGVENLPSLEHISFSIRCKLEELDDVAAEFREFLDTYPNNLTCARFLLYNCSIYTSTRINHINKKKTNCFLPCWNIISKPVYLL